MFLCVFVVCLSSPCGSRTTCRAEDVSTPSDHSRVSMSMWPRSCWRGMALGFMVYCLTTRLILPSAARSILHRVDFPAPLGPTTTTPIRCRSCSYSSRAFFIYTQTHMHTDRYCIDVAQAAEHGFDSQVMHEMKKYIPSVQSQFGY